MSTTAHVAGEGYSGANKVPTVQGFQVAQEEKQHQPLPPTPAVPPPNGDQKKSGQEEKAEIMERLQGDPKKKPTDKAKKRDQRWVKDPVTGQQVLVKDPEFEDFRGQGFDNDALDPAKAKAGPALRAPPPQSAQDSRLPAPAPADVGNILLQQFPSPVSEPDLEHAKSILRLGAIVTSIGCFITWIFVALGPHVGWMAFFFRSSLLGGVVFCAWVGAENAGRKVEKELERVRMDMHRQRGEENSPPTPESVEWLNGLLKVVWGLVNPDMFIPITDMVEDVLQASLPSLVDAVRIADVGQGTNPLRIVSMRALPDQPGHPDYPREEWVGLDKDKQSKEQAQESEKGTSDDPATEIDTDQTGDYLNYEISVSYQALPGQSKSLRRHNIHLMLEFFVGLWDWVNIPIPIYAIVEGFVATVRMRIQFIQNPPFVRNMTITLMGVPKVEVSVEPFTKKLPNILDLPGIARFVQMGIAAACAEYVAPKSLTLNLAQLLAGDGVKKDTKAMGVIVVTIHHAVDLSKQDRNSSDPYIVLAYAKFGKPLYSTRIIQGDLNPVWEETAFLLVSDDEVKGEEDVSITLWDSDKRSADDLVGRVVVPLTEIMAKPNTMHPRVDHLKGFEDANDMPGTLYWDIGYYEKAPLNKALKRTEENPNVPKEVADKKEVQEKPTMADSQEEADALRTPPDPEIPSGILSVIVHQINNLERQDIKGTTGDREGQAGQDTSEPAEEGGNLPNGYCEIIINDDMIYKTRVKQYTSMPYFEAGTEKFVRDWRNTIVRVQVRDARTREKDPVLGVVTVNLQDIFKNSSQVTRLFSLQEGVGYGRANISFLFRQVKTNLPKNLLGWETATAEILSSITIEPTPEFSEGFNTKKLTLSTTDDSYKAPSSSATVRDGLVSWDLPVEKVRLPVYNRYSSAVLFEIGSGGPGPIGSDSDFIAVVWLQDVPDDEEIPVRVPVIKSPKLAQIRQNYINDQTAKTHQYEVVGWLSCTMALDSGLDPDHEEHQTTRDEKHRYEAYDRVEGQAETADRNAELANRDDVTRGEKKDIEGEKKRQLQMRHRGVMQYKPVRTAVWSKEGMKRRARSLKNKVTGNKDREPTVETEA